MVKRYAAAALSLSLAALVTACSSSASQEEQMEYLHKMAQRGAELHAVKKGSQGHGTPGDREECYGAYEHLYDGPNGHDAPHVGTDVERVALLKEGEELFIESCVNGTPSPVPARGGSASPSA
ncbi:hypothetical protein EAD89_09750 [Micromonospora sp. BL4]|uniref:hypothetical protein n=1 Tax=Micromonospora sp. BL4 TaxID=2478710 RepID=UPI000EF57858|nr:hypothetical protein [Micromonospora sp. BL4]RLP91998.1 hypothetical protein EAD89_09750 [Micromonospora sp. BL4]